MSAQRPATVGLRLDDRAAKGLWVLLVAVGHVAPFAALDDRLWLWLYQWHVVAFLLLPFLREEQRLTGGRWLDRLVRYLVPLVPIVAITLVLYGWMPGSRPIGDRLVAVGQGLLFGHGDWWKLACGFQFLWFLPTLLGLTAVRQLFRPLPSAVRWTVAVAGALALPWLRPYAQWLPLGLATVLWILPWGLVAAWAAPRLLRGDRDLRGWLVVPALACGGWLIAEGLAVNVASLIGPLPADHPLGWLASGVSAVGMFLATTGALLWLGRSRLLCWLGEASLPFYLTHSLALQLVFQVASLWMPGWKDTPAGLATVGMLALATALTTALPVCLWVLRRPWLRRWWLPADRADWPPTAWLLAKGKTAGP